VDAPGKLFGGITTFRVIDKDVVTELSDPGRNSRTNASAPACNHDQAGAGAV
jgi:hypothetical protein